MCYTRTKCFGDLKGSSLPQNDLVGPTEQQDALMKPRFIVAILMITGLPMCAEAQQPSAAKAKADAQRVVKMIIGDKAKSQTYCDVVKLGEQIEETDPKDKRKADELSQQVDELATKLGPEYIALMNELQDMDPDSEDGKEIGSTLEALEKLCSK
jgi:hypothetical protein